MATRGQATSSAQRGASEAANNVKQTAKPFKEFVKKFQNDWSVHLAQALAFSLLTAIVPIAILMFGIVGLFVGGLDKQQVHQLSTNITHAFPAQIPSADVVTSAFDRLKNASFLLVVLAILTAIIFGSRLFTLMEVCFDVIYRLQPRSFMKKNLIAIGMLILFVILIPVLVLASTIPGIVLAVLQNAAIGNTSAITNFFGLISSLIVSFLLFEAFYVFIPNRTENVKSVMYRFRSSWKGAAVAAVALQLMLQFFPLYIRFFTKAYVGQIALVLIVVAFFYLFALIILLGAEVNAFFSEGIRPTASDLISRASKTS